MTWKVKHPVVSVVEAVYTSRVKLTAGEMEALEAEMIRLPSLEKWFVKIPRKRGRPGATWLLSRPSPQRLSALMTSPADLVPRAHQVVLAMELLIALTDPSIISKFTIPGCRLAAVPIAPRALSALLCT